MNEFEKYELVTITNTQSPFYLWAGPIEKIITGENGFVRYVVKASYRGIGIYGTLLLTMMDHHLAKGLPAEDAS